MTRFALVFAMTLAAVSFSTFATAQSDFQSVVPAPIQDQHQPQGQNRNDRGSDPMLVFLDASDHVSMSQDKSRRPREFRAQQQFQ